MWKTVYDSVQGASHLRTDTPCQDACRVICEELDGKELLIIACADGAGSAEHAEVGSTVACDELVKLVQMSFTCQGFLNTIEKETVTDWLHRIRNTIDQRAKELQVETRQLATTLFMALLGEDVAIFFQIGDGAIIIRNSQGFRWVFWPQSGEYANTTNFLTDESFEEHVAFEKVCERITECVAFTDGLERLILRFDDRTVHRAFIEPMLHKMRQAEIANEFFQPLRAFLDSDAINERTDDDKTLVLATRLGGNEDSLS